MGYYEAWDNVWCDGIQVMGWVCPRCEKFVPMYDEHSCEAVEADHQMQTPETQWHEASRHLGAL